MSVAFVGGTGPAGIGLAARFALAGIPVALGSRAAERAAGAAAAVRDLATGNISSGTNEEIVRGAEVVFLTVPSAAVAPTAEAMASALAGKIVVSMANPIRVKAGKVAYEPPPEGSLAELVAARIPAARVVSAFHEIRVSKFADVEHPIDADTLICGDEAESKRRVVGLVDTIKGMRAIDAGPLSNSRYIEGFVAVLISMNLIHTGTTSYRITGLPGTTIPVLE